MNTALGRGTTIQAQALSVFCKLGQFLSCEQAVLCFIQFDMPAFRIPEAQTLRVALPAIRATIRFQEFRYNSRVPCAAAPHNGFSIGLPLRILASALPRGAQVLVNAWPTTTHLLTEVLIFNTACHTGSHLLTVRFFIKPFSTCLKTNSIYCSGTLSFK
jgi:hypothetical protein